ncbi:MAG: hypothetical protein CM15mP77_1290 [Synechococcus sp.]|nr:MAG: hypothetical protein CM15mP77_1290 [Synechococcus sp.]
MELLLNRLQQKQTSICILVFSPQPKSNDLIVAADGPRSTTRLQWGIRCWTFRYRQGCLTSKVALGACNRHGLRAVPIRRATAILPLGEGSFRWFGVHPGPMPAARRPATPEFLGRVGHRASCWDRAGSAARQPRAFPQHWSLAQTSQPRQRRAAREAGHRCHPVGGRGSESLLARRHTLITSLSVAASVSAGPSLWTKALG